MEEIIFQNSSLYSRYLIGEARYLMLKATQKELAPYNISPRQAYILFILYNHGHKAKLAELANHGERLISTLSIQIARMEKMGLVKKIREPHKTTLLSIELTEKGINVCKNSNKMDADQEIMSVLSEEERQQLIPILKKIIGKATEYISS